MSSKGGRILVLGDVMLDHYIEGNVTRISPEAPVPVVHVQKDHYMLGGAANVAANLTSLGAPASLCGVVSDDPEGRRIRQLLDTMGIEQYLQTDGGQTTTKTRVIAGRQQIARIDREDISRPQAIDLKLLFERLPLDDVQLLVLSDYHKGALTPQTLPTLFQQAHVCGLRVLVDPKGRDWEKYTGAFLVTPNLKELSEVYGDALDNLDDGEVAEAARAVRRRFGFEQLLVTRSERGMTLIHGDDSVAHFKTHVQDVFDVTGAGDTVLATLAFCLHSGKSLEQSVHIANYAAGLSVAHLGTYRVARAEIAAYLLED